MDFCRYQYIGKWLVCGGANPKRQSAPCKMLNKVCHQPDQPPWVLLAFLMYCCAAMANHIGHALPFKGYYSAANPFTKKRIKMTSHRLDTTRCCLPLTAQIFNKTRRDRSTSSLML